ncbi:polysaccharide deacetylase family protein, partial [Bacteroidota bacterium]
MKRISIVATAAILSLTVFGQDKSNFSWPENYTSAVVLTYDDGLDCHLDVAVPALDAHGFKSTFYCTGDSPSLDNRMDDWRTIVKNGHELGNHTLFHPCDGSRFDWVTSDADLQTYT